MNMEVSELTKHIVEGLLGEDAKKDVAVYAGSFRPPTKSDYNLLLKALEDNPGLDEIHVFVGDSESEGLDQDDSVAIWRMFGEHFPRDFYVHKSEESPVSDVYAYASKFPTYDIDWLFGVREGNSDDFKQVADRTKSVRKYDNVSISPVVYDKKATEREVGAAANMGKDELAKYMPNNLTYKELDDIYNMLKPKQLQETIYQYPDDIVEKIVDEGWEYYETMGNLPSKAAKVAKQARKENKKLFTLAYERDSSSDPVIQYINVFWSDKGSGPNRDVIEGGTMQDYEDIRDAGQLYLQEVATDDLAKFEEVIEKIVDGGYKQYQRGQRLSRFHRSTLIDDMKKTAEEDGVPGYFALSLFPGGEVRAIVHFSDDTSYPLGELSPQDIKDIEDAADINLQEVKTDDLLKFEEVIEKIVDEGWEYLSISGADKWMSSKINDYLAWRGNKDNKKYFYVKDAGPDDGAVIFFPYERTNYSFEKMTDEELNDIILAGSLNEVDTEDLAKYETVVDKISQGGYEYYPAEKGLPLIKKTADKLNKNLFSVIQNVSGGGMWNPDAKKKYSTTVFLATPDSTEVEKHFIFDTTKQDLEDLLGAAGESLDTVLKEADINLQEVDTDDLVKYETVVDKIAEEGYEYFPAEDLPDTSNIKGGLNIEASHQKKKLFTITQYASGGGMLNPNVPKQYSTFVYLTKPDSIDVEQFIIHNTTKEDLEDLLGAAGESLDTVIKEAKNLTRFEDMLNKIAEGDYYYQKINSNKIAHLEKAINLIKNDLKFDKPFFVSTDRDEAFNDDFAVIFSDDAENIFWIKDMTDQDYKDFDQTIQMFASKIPEEKSVLKEAENIVDYEDYLNRIADGDYYYVPALDDETVLHVDMRHNRLKKNLDLDKPLFSYFVDEYTRRGEKKRDLVFVFSDQDKGHYTIAEDIDDADLKDLEQAVELFTKPIPARLMKEAVEFEYDPVHGLDHYEDLMRYMSKNGLNIEPFPKIKFVDDDADNAENLFGKTAYYDPNNKSVVLYTYGRHPKDIMRSFAHELVHVHQDNEGRIGNLQTTNTNEDDDLVDLEKEAYLKGNILFRQWTDSLKEKKKEYGIDAYAAELARLRENKENLSEQAETIRKIYCDINDVLAGTDTPEVAWTDDGRRLWAYLFTIPKPVTLLSSTTNRDHKEQWIQNAFHKQLTPKVIFRDKEDKPEFSEPGALLIDNKEETIKNWEEKGGTGILHKNTDDTIKQLNDLGLYGNE